MIAGEWNLDGEKVIGMGRLVGEVSNSRGRFCEGPYLCEARGKQTVRSRNPEQ